MNVRDYVAAISFVGLVLTIILSDFNSYFYPIPLLCFLLLFVVLFIETLINTIRKGVSFTKPRVVVYLVSVICILALVVDAYIESNSRIIFCATVRNERFTSVLLFKDNGVCYNWIKEYSGYGESVKGKYVLKGDTIFFKNKPVDGYYMVDRMLSDTLLIDKKQHKLLLHNATAGFSHIDIFWNVEFYEIVEDFEVFLSDFR